MSDNELIIDAKGILDAPLDSETDSVIRRLINEIAKLHRYLDLMEVADYYDDFECPHKTVLTSKLGKKPLHICKDCGAVIMEDDDAQINNN